MAADLSDVFDKPGLPEIVDQEGDLESHTMPPKEQEFNQTSIPDEASEVDE